MRKVLNGLAAAVALAAVTANALDREATMIGSATVETTQYKDMRGIKAVAYSEVPLHAEIDWAIVASAGWGKFTDSGLPDANLWTGSLGVKWYATERGNLTVTAKGDFMDESDAYRLFGGAANYEFRIHTKSASITPFAFAGVEVSSVDPGGRSERFTALFLRAGVGCDFMLRKDFALVLQLNVTDSSDLTKSDFKDYADGWSAALSMKYYWD